MYVCDYRDQERTSDPLESFDVGDVSGEELLALLPKVSSPALLYRSDSTVMLNFSLLQMKLESLEVHRSHLSLLPALTAEDHNTSFLPWRICVEWLKRTGASLRSSWLLCLWGPSIMGILCSVGHGLVSYLGIEQKEEASPLGYTCLDLLTHQQAASSKRINTCSSWEGMTLLEAWGRWNPVACIRWLSVSWWH